MLFLNNFLFEIPGFVNLKCDKLRLKSMKCEIPSYLAKLFRCWGRGGGTGRGGEGIYELSGCFTIYPAQLSCYQMMKKVADSKLNLPHKNVILTMDRVQRCQICSDDPKLRAIQKQYK